MRKLVYLTTDKAPNSPNDLLGGKGAGLIDMMGLGIPVPPAFVITTEACDYYWKHDHTYPPELHDQVEKALENMERVVGAKFGDTVQPLLVSVRSGARVSMPGMMDTVLNLGLTEETVKGLAHQTSNPRFAYDAYRRLITMYGDVVFGVHRHHFEQSLTNLKRRLGNPSLPDPQIPSDSLKELVTNYDEILRREIGKSFPQDVREQLWGAIGAVFRSWMNKRAIVYRRLHGYPDSWGTAVTVQAMVFGNMGDDCGTGVAFTRNPSTGEKKLYGEFLRNAQGEDVVAGIRTPRPLTADGSERGRENESLELAMPESYKELVTYLNKLETNYRDMQDVEFTIQRGKVWILQTRSGKRTAFASIRVAVDLVREGMISETEAVLRVDASSIDQLLHPRVPSPDRMAEKGILPIAAGLPASPGGASGRIMLDASDAEEAAQAGQDVILVRGETNPEDIHGMKAAKGILTATGGMTSHAAVVARGMGKPCVAGCHALMVDYAKGLITIRTNGGTIELKTGDVITVDGSTGNVYRDATPVEVAAVSPDFETFMSWVDKRRRMRVRANADTPEAAMAARSLGAEGIGLCRTEHMFFAEDRLLAVRCWVLSNEGEERRNWLAKIEPMQERDFVDIFRAMNGYPVTIRLLDWPLHEFMPKQKHELDQVAQALGVQSEIIEQRASSLREINPMLGHRGVRLGLTHAELYAAQTRAILRAAAKVTGEGVRVAPEIMIPVVSVGEEIHKIAAIVHDAAQSVQKESGQTIAYKFGTMIELPRACLVADSLAQHAEFFSFGTNDLTQTTFGISRDDAGHFLPEYMSERLRLLHDDPFATLDPDGVGELVRIASKKGRTTRADIKLGICGEHGGDPRSVAFCESVGLDYVSCSPFRIPIARIAAAQASIRGEAQAPNSA